MNRWALRVCVGGLLLAPVGGCGNAPSNSGALDESSVFMTFEPELQAANETLVFPFVAAPEQLFLSETSLGDLVVAYTRVGCGAVPDQVIGEGSYAEVMLPHSAPQPIKRVSISQELSSIVSADDALALTCLSLKPEGGAWRAVSFPSQARTTSDTIELEFEVPSGKAVAGAIFLPTFTRILTLSYSVGAP